MGSHSGASHTLRTHQYDSKWLNEPQFVGSFEDDKFVFFVFREAAVEYINCGKVRTIVDHMTQLISYSNLRLLNSPPKQFHN